MQNQPADSHDTETLIKQEESSNSCSSSAGIFLFIHFLPIITCFLFSLMKFNFYLSFLIILILGIGDFILTRNYFGYGLVGLKWYFNPSEASNFPYIVFFSRPLPFVATTIDSNAFWLGLFINFAMWVLLVLLSAGINGFNWMLLCGIMLILSLFNFWGFMKCHNFQQSKADDAIRTVLLDTTDAFQAANEVGVGGSSSSENDEDIDEEEENDNDENKVNDTTVQKA